MALSNRVLASAGIVLFLSIVGTFFDLTPLINYDRLGFNRNGTAHGSPALHLNATNRTIGTLNRTFSLPHFQRTVVASGNELRILPLGDSITYGYQPTDDGNHNNGYRLQLQSDLSGSKLLFVGSVSSGSMSNNANEGHSGATISEIEGFASLSLNDRPNVVLIHAGTNDLNSGSPKEPYATAPDRLDSLISKVLSVCPDATVLVAQIIHIRDAAADARVQTFNSRVPGLVAAQVANGHTNIAAVDFSSVTSGDLIDGLHPTNSGYEKMGDIWFSAIQNAASKGWIKAPVGPDPSGTGTGTGHQECLSGLFWYPAQNGAQIASGVGHGGDAKFVPNWVPPSPSQVASGIGHNATGVQLVDLDGDGRADYVWVDPESGAVTAYLNTKGANNGITWIPLNGAKPIASGGGPGAGVILTDLDNDGKADYLFVHDGGAVDAWYNGGPKSDGTWNWIGPTQIASGVPNANPKTVLFADINGDGRADYLVKGPTGSLNMWLNTGDVGSQKITWIPAGEIAGGLGTPNITLADITGDAGRADYLIFDNDGGLSGYLNIRGQSETKPIWIPQGGAKSIAGGVSIPDLVRLADMDGDGKADYCYLDAKMGALSVYYNRGKADTSVTGDGLIFADIDGDGLDDYVFVDENGILTAYVNGGSRADGSNGWVWYPQGQNGIINTGIGATRDQIQLADINGDGRADYLAIDQVSGAVTCYLNGGRNPDAPDGWVWLPQGPIATGIGRDGKGVRFADINGDGRADYVWISEKGEIELYINEFGINPAKFIPYNDQNFIASGVGGSRGEIRLADIK
ncbi:MAG: hypothetical protein Q9218_005918 [Villophora microphyllina]